MTNDNKPFESTPKQAKLLDMITQPDEVNSVWLATEIAAEFDDLNTQINALKAELNPPIVEGKYCVPQESGLASEAAAVGRRLGRLLTALGNEINDHVVDGQIASDVRELRMKIHTTIQGEGWRIEATDNGYRVLQPKDR